MKPIPVKQRHESTIFKTCMYIGKRYLILQAYKLYPFVTLVNYANTLYRLSSSLVYNVQYLVNSLVNALTYL